MFTALIGVSEAGLSELMFCCLGSFFQLSETGLTLMRTTLLRMIS